MSFTVGHRRRAGVGEAEGEVRMDRTVVKMTTLKDADEAICPSLSIAERIRVLEELNRIGRLAVGYPNSRLDRSVAHFV